MSSPIVRVLFQGRLLQCVPFTGDKLRIGRRKDNDIVINNLSVSRAHAELVREGEVIRLVDGGSENGSFVNGVRASEVEIGPGDELIIGKHQLLVEWDEAPAVVAEAPQLEDPQLQTHIFSAPSEPDDIFDEVPAAEASAPPAEPEPESSAQDDAAADAFLNELVGGESPAAPEFSVSTDAAEGPDEADFPAVVSVEAPAADFPAVVSVEAPAADFPAVASVEEHEIEFPESSAIAAEEVDFAAADGAGATHAAGEDELESDLFDFAPLAAEEAAPAAADVSPVDVSPVVLEAPALAPAPEAPPAQSAAQQTATVTVRQDGEPAREIPWERPVLVIGRTGDCDVVLADPKISRRHAELERNENGFWVRDLESINFTFVNGEKITERQLRAGDVVSIEGFELQVTSEALSEPAATTAAPTAPATSESPIAVEVDTNPEAAEGGDGATDGEPDFELNDPVDDFLEAPSAAAQGMSSVDAEAADLLATLAPMDDPENPPDSLEMLGGDASSDFAILASPEPEPDQQAYTAFPEDPGPVEDASSFDAAGLDFGFEGVFDAPSEAAGPSEAASHDEDPPTLPPFGSGAAEESDDELAEQLSESFDELRDPDPPPPQAPAADVFEEPGGQLRDDSGIESLFDGDDLDQEKPDDAQGVALGDLTPQISFQPDPTQTPMPSRRIFVVLSLRTEELPPKLQRLLHELDAEDLRLPVEVKLRVED